MALVPVPVLKTYKTHAFVDGVRDGRRFGEFTEVELPGYPPEPRGKELRRLRQAAGLGLREACRRLHLQPVQLCGLERGSLTFTTDAEWVTALDALRQPGGHGAPVRRWWSED